MKENKWLIFACFVALGFAWMYRFEPSGDYLEFLDRWTGEMVFAEHLDGEAGNRKSLLSQRL